MDPKIQKIFTAIAAAFLALQALSMTVFDTVEKVKDRYENLRDDVKEGVEYTVSTGVNDLKRDVNAKLDETAKMAADTASDVADVAKGTLSSEIARLQAELSALLGDAEGPQGPQGPPGRDGQSQSENIQDTAPTTTTTQTTTTSRPTTTTSTRPSPTTTTTRRCVASIPGLARIGC